MIYKIIILFIVLAMFGYLLLKINDRVSYKKAFELLEKVNSEIKKNYELIQTKNVNYNKKYKPLLDILSKSAMYNVSKIPKNTKLIDIFCAKKELFEHAKNVERLSFVTKTHYCPFAEFLFDEMNDLYQKYLKENPRIDRKALYEKMFPRLLSYDEVMNTMFDMSIEEFLENFFILIDNRINENNNLR
jgi:hypothetical protein